MSIIEKIILKLRIEARFLLEQKWGIKKPADPYTIPKYILKRFLPANAVIIDCGAHVGADSLELAKIFPSGRIHSFEPVPFLFEKLKRTTRQTGNVSCYQLALSNTNNESRMFVSSGGSDASSSLLSPTGHISDHPDVIFSDIIDVTAMTLDRWAAVNKVSHVDFLWLDMQGFEFYMLQASEKILPSVKAIHTEVSVREAYEHSKLYPEFKTWLEGRGFKEIYKAIPKGADMGNVLFVRQ